jgi:acyl-CoA thioesterase YciA
MVFIRPVYVGDVVSCFAHVVKRGRTSIGIGIEVWVERLADESILKVTEGVFTYVAIDKNGRPTPIQWEK